MGSMGKEGTDLFPMEFLDRKGKDEIFFFKCINRG